MGLPQRHSRTVSAPPRTGGAPAINPSLILAVRFLLSLLVSCFALASAIVAILVVKYYNDHDIIAPSWGSLIYIIFLGIVTPMLYFGYNILLPIAPFINYGDFLFGIMMVKIELLFQFAMSVLWVSGALAYASDLRGYENCTFDGYYHQEKPANFMHVCDLINYVVPLAYTAFGLQALLFSFELLFGLYTFLYLDQESLSEPHYAWGRRAYDYRTGASQTQSNNGRGGAAYRARAINADDSSFSSNEDSQTRGAGRRGAAYHDEERGSEEMGESDAHDGPATVGSRGRGRRGYIDEDEEDPHSAADAYDGVEEEDERGWHLRQEHA